MSTTYNILARKYEGRKRALVRHKQRWGKNIQPA
jgi:hypothetical protein